MPPKPGSAAADVGSLYMLFLNRPFYFRYKLLALRRELHHLIEPDRTFCQR
jgi:hypothetical protein